MPDPSPYAEFQQPAAASPYAEFQSPAAQTTTQAAPLPQPKSGFHQVMDAVNNTLNYPLGKLLPTYDRDTAHLQAIAQPNTPYEQQHPILGPIRRYAAKAEMGIGDMLTPGMVAGGALGALGGVAGQAASIGGKVLSGAYGAAGADNAYNAATTPGLSMGARAAGVGLGAAGAVMGAAGTGALKPVSSALQSSAENQYSKFLNPTTNEAKFKTGQVVPQLLAMRQKATSLGGLANTAAGKLEQLGPLIGDAVNNIPASVTPNMTPIQKAVDDYRNSFLVNGVPVNPQGVNQADRVGKLVSDLQAASPGTPSFQDMNKTRQILDTNVAQSRGYAGKTLAEGSGVDADKTLANAIRGQLAASSPDVAALNKQYNMWSNVQDVADATTQRKTGQIGGLVKNLAAPLIGASVGGHSGSVLGGAEGAAAMTALHMLMTSPAYRTTAAVTKSAIADSLKRGDFAGVTKMAQAALGSAAYQNATPANVPAPTQGMQR